MVKFYVLCGVLAVLLILAAVLNLWFGMAMLVVYAAGGGLVVGWMLLPAPAIVTRFWTWLGA